MNPIATRPQQLRHEPALRVPSGQRTLCSLLWSLSGVPRADRVAALIGVVTLHRVSLWVLRRAPAEQNPRFEVSVLFAVGRYPALTRNLIGGSLREFVRVNCGEVTDLPPHPEQSAEGKTA